MNLRRLRHFFQGGRLLVAIGVLVVLVLLTARFVSGLYIDVLWFKSVGYSHVFWTRTLWQWGVRLVAAVVTAALVFINLRVVSRTLGGIHIKRRVGDLEISEKLPRSYILWAAAGVALLVGLWFGAAIPGGAGIRSLVLVRAPSWGTTDPILGRDLSFYVFVLPMLRAVLAFGLVLLFLIVSLCGAAYAATGSLGFGENGVTVGRTARLHLTWLCGAFLALLAARFWLAHYDLLQNGNSAVQGIFGYADAHARLPAYEALSGLTAACAAGLVWGGVRNRARIAISSMVALFVGGIGLTQVYPSMVQRFQVEPNELARETPYIRQNLAYTRLGFGLNHLDRRPFKYTPPEKGFSLDEAEKQLSGFPIWTQSALLTTYREVEARFPYYQFPEVDFDRYPSSSGTKMVAISARQIDPGSIQDPNWQNLHLRKRYITGMGVVASAATGRTPQGRPPMYVSSIPPELSPDSSAPRGLDVKRPSFFFGSRPQLYSVLDPGEGILEGPKGQPLKVGVDYPPGIRLDSPLRTLALAWRFRDANLLFATQISDSSRFVFRRQVQQRVREIAPFLDFFEAPYPVVAGGRLVWVLEGFTDTRDFPLAAAYQTPLRRSVSYVRNSVKVTVDAVTGTVRFYSVTDDDPLLQAYERAFPGLFHPMSEMPAAVRSHLRYPRSLLELQADVLRLYHQETARQFHGQQDVWTRPQELGQGSRSIPYRAQYAYYKLPGETKPGFMLSTVFVPVGRQNLTGILVARSDPGHYGQLVLLDVAVEDQVRGPRQVEAVVEQDPTISQQFSLWRTGGSQVWTGHLHLVPVGGSLLYMEPIFLAASEDAIPELRRFVVSDGRSVAMTADLDDAVSALAEGRAATVTQKEAPTEGGVPTATGMGVPAEALQLLDSADARIRRGDWAGFGQAWDRLRSILRNAGPGSGSPPATGAAAP